jgi:chromatin structure-remodeling complex subunit RSC1/2
LGPIPTSSPSEKPNKDDSSSSGVSDSDSNHSSEEDDDDGADAEDDDAVVEEDDGDEEYEEKGIKLESAPRPGLRVRPQRSITKFSPGAEDKKVGTGKTESAPKPETAVVRKRKRGRPPKIDTPEEARIRTALRAVRKVKDRDGRQLFLEFEKLPDPELYPDYHNEIKRPIALDHITVLLRCP